MRVGDRLPTEKELSAVYRVSRTVVREAISQLRQQSILEGRQGSGVYVRTLSPASFTLEKFTCFEDFRNVYELRNSVEVGAARLASERHDAADLTRLQSAIDAMEDPRSRAAADLAFHACIARASRNPLYADLVSSIGASLECAINSAVENTIKHHADYQTSVVVEHRRVVAAIQSRNPLRAERAMATHIRNAMGRLGLLGSPVVAAPTFGGNSE